MNEYNSNIQREILFNVSKGHKPAFVHLVHQYKDHIYTIAFRLTRSTPLAEDIVQDIFMKIWMRRNSLVTINNFTGYLNTMIQNTVFTVLKRMALEQKRLKQIDHSEGYFIDSVLNKEYETVLNQAIRQLPSRQQQVYQLVKEKGMKREEAAEVLNISSETVKYHLAQAVRGIREYCVTHFSISVLLIPVLVQL